MLWAALYRRPPILRGVSAAQIRADHAANQARINARYGSALPRSPLLGSAFTPYILPLIVCARTHPGRHFGYADLPQLGRLDRIAQRPYVPKFSRFVLHS